MPNNINLDHADLLEASGAFADEDFDTEQERENYSRYLDELYEKDRERRAAKGLR